MMLANPKKRFWGGADILSACLIALGCAIALIFGSTLVSQVIEYGLLLSLTSDLALLTLGALLVLAVGAITISMYSRGRRRNGLR